jgi:succinoglycan biosynthesis protein ExoL
MLLAAGFEVQVYAFKRDYFTGNSFPPEVEVIDLGKILTGNYFNRITKLLKAIFWIKRQENTRKCPPALTYAFGLDMALLGHFAISGSVPLVYETGDLQNPLPHRSLKARAMAAADKFVVRKADLLATTSPKFISEYFNVICPGVENHSVVVENLVSEETARIFPRPSQPKDPAFPIRIGFIGRLRYPECLLPLMEAVRNSADQFELHIHGVGPLRETIENFAGDNPNISYHGSFKNPDDLGEIYRTIDINFVVYDNRDANVCLALPNKLYESPYFGTPLVVAAGTHLADRVIYDGIGIIVDPGSPDFATRLLGELTPELLVQLSRNTLELPQSRLVENFDGLKKTLIELAT